MPSAARRGQTVDFLPRERMLPACGRQAAEAQAPVVYFKQVFTMPWRDTFFADLGSSVKSPASPQAESAVSGRYRRLRR